MFANVNDVKDKFAQWKYIIDEEAATVIFLAYKLAKPLLVEGPAGVGKTELAKVLGLVTGRRLIRLQCYEGLDETRALYEWDYHKQLLCIQAEQGAGKSWKDIKSGLFSTEFLLVRPLLEAITSQQPVVLLVDEVDKSDDEFESLLLEILADFQVTVPELGTIRATTIPLVVLTSNNTRDFGDALKRRCLHLYLDYPSPEREYEIIKLKLTGVKEALLTQVVNFVHQLRQMKLKKPPSIAESIEWTKSLLELGKERLTEEAVQATLPVLLKYQNDIKLVRPQVVSLVGRV